jgi:acetyl esterase/lipase
MPDHGTTTPKPDPLKQNRLDMETEAAKRPLPDGVHHEAVTLDGVPCEWTIPENAHADTCIVYAHGGAFCVGSVNTHRPLVSHIAKACGCALLSVDYRLAPENGFPAATDDVFTAYRAILNRYRHIIVMGDSAGGSLAAGVPLHARAAALPMPAGLVLLSPWLDLTCSARSFETNADSDPFMTHKGALFVVRGYLKKTDAAQPLASPLFADLQGYPPTLLQVSQQEVLLDDSTRFAAAAESAGVDVQLSIWNGVYHVWHTLYDESQPARDAVAEIGRFVQRITPH